MNVLSLDSKWTCDNEKIKRKLYITINKVHKT